MAIPKKGSRAIVVNDVEYRWLIRKLDMNHNYGPEEICVAVERTEPDTQTMIIHTWRFQFEDGSNPIMPSDIRLWI